MSEARGIKLRRKQNETRMQIFPENTYHIVDGSCFDFMFSYPDY